MIYKQFIQQLTEEIKAALPDSWHIPADEINHHIKHTLSTTFDKLEVVTREEFDVQTKLLARTRERVNILEAQVLELEACIQSSKDKDTATSQKTS